MEPYTSVDWVNLWINTILIISILVSLSLLVTNKVIKVSNLLLNLLGIAIVLYFIYEPILIYSDKYSYQYGFKNALEGLKSTKAADSGFSYLTKFIKYFIDSFFIYLLLIATVYIFGYLKFIKHFFSREYQFIVFFATICSLGFYAYGTNTLRQGLALSIFLIALVHRDRKFKYIIYALIAVLIHKSLIIPALAFYIIKKYNLKNNYIYFWFFCLFLTIVVGNSLAGYLGDFLSGSDNRLNNYVTGKNEVYNAGFKLNFLIYSIAPIVYGLKIKAKINNEFYNKMLSLYIVVNAIWLLVIRIPFTDRFAYLSWFLIPFIFLYPLSVQRIFKNQNSVIAIIILYLSMVCYLIAAK